jgi:hypothetical protein
LITDWPVNDLDRSDCSRPPLQVGSAAARFDRLPSPAPGLVGFAPREVAQARPVPIQTDAEALAEKS